MVENEKKQQEPYYRKYINYTTQLQNLEKIDIKEFIIDLKEGQSIIGRQFLLKDKRIGYEELLPSLYLVEVLPM